MKKLSPNFSRYEFACKCTCGQDTVDAELLAVLEDIREHFGRAVTINSGNRCKNYNETIGGVKHSQHLTGRAADIVVDGVDSAVVYRYVDKTYPCSLGLGGYREFTHIDSRNKRARW